MECAELPHPIVIIPARLRSHRLPDKVLAPIDGRPMILHVVERAHAASIGPVVVATDAPEVAAVVAATGCRVVMTSAGHLSGSDRVAEAARLTDPERRHATVVNLQGDEPEVDPAHIRAILLPLADRRVDIATLATPLARDEWHDMNAVKLHGQSDGAVIRVESFSREMPPRAATEAVWRHVGLYAFRRVALEHFVTLPPSPRETAARLEQWRALDAGMRIDAALVESALRGVDTPADLAETRARFARGARR